MPQSTVQVRVFPDGNLFLGPTTSDAPTDATTPLDNDFLDYGFATDAGAGFTPGITAFDIPAWQSALPVYTGVSQRTEEIVFELLQMTEEALALAHGGGTWTGASGSRTYDAPTALALDRRSMVLEATDGIDTIRFYWPFVTLTNVGQITMRKDGAASLPLTFSVASVNTTTPPLSIFHTFDNLGISDVS